MGRSRPRSRCWPPSGSSGSVLQRLHGRALLQKQDRSSRQLHNQSRSSSSKHQRRQASSSSSSS